VPRVGLSLLTLMPGCGGVETYSRELVKGLAQIDGLSYQVFKSRLPVDVPDFLPTKTIRSYKASLSTGARIAAMSQAVISPRRIWKEMGVGALDCVHFPASQAVPRLPRGLPTVVSIHDIQHETFPHHFSFSERYFLHATYGFAVRSSDLIITISEYSKNIIVERYGLNPDKVRVIYLGVESPTESTPCSERKPFLLYPANNWPHKNHDRLFSAFRILREEQPELTLVLTGARHSPGRLLPAGVVARGRVSQAELRELYRTAACLVFPSLNEGLGLPPLEAMSYGCPVASSNAAALPEACGEAAVLFDPYDVEAIADGVRSALSRAEELSAAGRLRAARFSWLETARQHDALYRELIESAPRRNGGRKRSRSYE
jgi:glycosyltransferase involved in cell wall biosynthesis